MVATASTGPPSTGTLTVVFATRDSPPCQKIKSSVTSWIETWLREAPARHVLTVELSDTRESAGVRKGRASVPLLRSCSPIASVWRRVEDHPLDFWKNAEGRKEQQNSHTSLKHVAEEGRPRRGLFTLFSRLLRRTVLILEESQSCPEQSK